MTTHPLWRPYDPPSDEEIAAARVGHRGPETVEVVPPDPGWPEQYDRVRASIIGALGDRVLEIDHIGSTSVPGLWAKPIIDVSITVPDSADEPAWLPDLERVGFVLRVREPEWDEHRCLRGREPRSNVHVWSPGAQEVGRHRAFRDWLRTDAADREAYASLKRELATRGYTDAMQYNNAKAGLIYDIYERIFVSDPVAEHRPRPREGGHVDSNEKSES